MVHDRQAAALAAFAALETKAVKLRAVLAVVEAGQRVALGQLAEVAGVDLTAELTGISVTKVRDALAHRSPRRRRFDNDG